uniref:Uncharacterized protein n=1 Tax=Oryza punctata TaxID=4537 RepID=A0A0E0JMM0_ORYPU
MVQYLQTGQESIARIRIIEKLSVKAPSAESKLKVLKAIAQEYGLEWDSSNTEAELNKKYEDLLDGSGSSARQGQLPIIENSPVTSISRDMPSLSISPVEDTGKYQGAPQSPSSPAGSVVTHAATKSNTVSQEHHRSPADEISCASPSSSDVLEKARAAIAAANRASAAARAAADLVKVKITS